MCKPLGVFNLYVRLFASLMQGTLSFKLLYVGNFISCVDSSWDVACTTSQLLRAAREVQGRPRIWTKAARCINKGIPSHLHMTLAFQLRSLRLKISPFSLLLGRLMLLQVGDSTSEINHFLHNILQEFWLIVSIDTESDEAIAWCQMCDLHQTHRAMAAPRPQLVSTESSGSLWKLV